jgi:hypothetical protein
MRNTRVMIVSMVAIVCCMTKYDINKSLIISTNRPVGDMNVSMPNLLTNYRKRK